MTTGKISNGIKRRRNVLTIRLNASVLFCSYAHVPNNHHQARVQAEFSLLMVRFYAQKAMFIYLWYIYVWF